MMLPIPFHFVLSWPGQPLPWRHVATNVLELDEVNVSFFKFHSRAAVWSITLTAHVTERHSNNLTDESCPSHSFLIQGVYDDDKRNCYRCWSLR